MQKLALASAISAVFTVPALASPMPLSGPNVIFYRTLATSAGISMAAGSASNIYYVNNASGTASNPAEAPIMLVKWSEWFIDTGSGAFNAKLYYGNYKTQINQTGLPVIDGRQTFAGVTQSFSGTGTWTSNHLSYSFFNPVVNGGGASVQTENSDSCVNGATNILGKVCTAFAVSSKAWEGLSFELDFFNSNYTFSGVLTAIDTAGSGLSRSTITTSWQIDAIDPPIATPVPAAAWLFGSALVGLGGAARRRNRKQ